MSRTYTVTVPDCVDLLNIRNVLLDAAYPDASAHALQYSWDDQGIYGVTHPHLGITIKEVR
jgi:hypothetical protein